VNTAIGNKTVPLDPRGFYEVFFAWDGRASNGRPASSGVYLVRLYGWKKEGNQSILVNDVQNIGWRIPAKN
jgi:flagellar hook assembly protein FlgD